VLPDGNRRASGYGFTGTPSVMFDGTVDFVGTDGGSSMYSAYAPAVNNLLTQASPLTITANYVVVDGEVTVNADIAVDQATGGANRQVMFFVAQADLHAHLNMVVAMLPDEPFNLTSPGQSVVVERTFSLAETWDDEELVIIVLVQDTVTKEIYQAGQASAYYAGTVVIDCIPDGLGAVWSLSGPGLTRTGEGDESLAVFAEGSYTISWADYPYWDTPTGPQTQTLVRDDTITFTGSYTGGPFGEVTADPLGDMAAAAAINLVDLDNDGDLDLHMTSNGTGDQLLRNDGDKVFVSLSTSPIVAVSDVRSAAWADINGDGNLDVYLTRNNVVDQLYLGDGAGDFTLAETDPEGDTGPGNSATWIDFNLDGILDLSVVTEDTANLLLAGQGELAPGFFLYNPVTGPFSNSDTGSCVVWGDGDLDGRPDPFIVNQFDGNVLLRNIDIGFLDLTNGQGMGDLGNGKGAAWGDYDNDGDLDLYVANDGQADRFYKCTGPFQYTRVLANGLDDMGHGRGVVWADFNNDTILDLYLARYDEPDLFLIGNAQGVFTSVPVGVDAGTMGSNALACGDIDGDGRLDVVVTREGAANVLMENKMDDGHHWVQLRLIGSGDNTQALGARVVLSAGGVSQTRFVSPGSGYRSCSAVDPHFGLGQATVIDQIDIYWPDGTHQVIGPQAVDRVIALTEGEDPPTAVGDSELPRQTALGGAYPNPFNPSTTIAFALNEAAQARVDVYTIDGRLVRTLTDKAYGAGSHQVVWTGTDATDRPLASGTYLYRLTTDRGFNESGSMVLVK